MAEEALPQLGIAQLVLLVIVVVLVLFILILCFMCSCLPQSNDDKGRRGFRRKASRAEPDVEMGLDGYLDDKKLPGMLLNARSSQSAMEECPRGPPSPDSSTRTGTPASLRSSAVADWGDLKLDSMSDDGFTSQANLLRVEGGLQGGKANPLAWIPGTANGEATRDQQPHAPFHEMEMKAWWSDGDVRATKRGQPRRSKVGLIPPTADFGDARPGKRRSRSSGVRPAASDLGGGRQSLTRGWSTAGSHLPVPDQDVAQQGPLGRRSSPSLCPATPDFGVVQQGPPKRWSSPGLLPATPDFGVTKQASRRSSKSSLSCATAAKDTTRRTVRRKISRLTAAEALASTAPALRRLRAAEESRPDGGSQSDSGEQATRWGHRPRSSSVPSAAVGFAVAAPSSVDGTRPQAGRGWRRDVHAEPVTGVEAEARLVSRNSSSSKGSEISVV
uniref:Uncharacterized protein n=1 Tax=Alexandrium monilatum TaxID=311494 RepID=A0A7S4VB47_9DINO